MNLISTCYRGHSHVPWSRGNGWSYPIWRQDRRSFGDIGCDRSPDRTFLERFRHSFFQVFPRPILGVILFFAGVELALVVQDIRLSKQNLFVLLVTAGTAMWNMGVAYLVGLLLYYGIQRRWVKV